MSFLITLKEEERIYIISNCCIQSSGSVAGRRKYIISPFIKFYFYIVLNTYRNWKQDRLKWRSMVQICLVLTWIHWRFLQFYLFQWVSSTRVLVWVTLFIPHDVTASRLSSYCWEATVNTIQFDYYSILQRHWTELCCPPGLEPASTPVSIALLSYCLTAGKDKAPLSWGPLHWAFPVHEHNTVAWGMSAE